MDRHARIKDAIPHPKAQSCVPPSSGAKTGWTTLHSKFVWTSLSQLVAPASSEPPFCPDVADASRERLDSPAAASLERLRGRRSGSAAPELGTSQLQKSTTLRGGQRPTPGRRHCDPGVTSTPGPGAAERQQRLVGSSLPGRRARVDQLGARIRVLTNTLKDSDSLSQTSVLRTPGRVWRRKRYLADFVRRQGQTC